MSGGGSTLSEALESAGRALASDPAFLGHRVTDGVLRIHRVVETRTLPRGTMWLGWMLDPTRDGLQRGGDEARAVVLPDVMQKYSDPPVRLDIPGVVQIRIGVDGNALLEDLRVVNGPMMRLRFRQITEKD